MKPDALESAAERNSRDLDKSRNLILSVAGQREELSLSFLSFFCRRFVSRTRCRCRGRFLPAGDFDQLHIFEWAYRIRGTSRYDFASRGVHGDEVTDLRAPDIRIRIVQPSPWIVRRGHDLRWWRLAQWNVSDQPYVIARAKRRSDLVAYRLRGIF
jgi:hypothetical protein